MRKLKVFAIVSAIIAAIVGGIVVIKKFISR